MTNHSEQFIATLQNIFCKNGVLQQSIPNYNYRPQQWQLAEKIAATLIDGGTLLAQAGTGTGKTFAYLIPALLCGGKIIISTASKTLQEQLYNKDLPLIVKVLNLPKRISLLKGRNNYVCQYYLQEAVEHNYIQDEQEKTFLQKINQFAKTSTSGDKNECISVPENANIWQKVTATKDTCLGSKCGFFNSCFLMQARREALLADVIVVNHHLFIADLMLKQNDIEMLPKAHGVIFDEAHHLPQIATNFFGYRISTLQIIDLYKDIAIQGYIHCPDIAWQTICFELDKQVKQIKLLIKEGKYQNKDLQDKSEFIQETNILHAHLTNINQLLSTNAIRHEVIAKLYERSSELLANLNIWLNINTQYIHWVDVTTSNINWHTTPLNIAKQFSSYQQQTWIFTSATIAVQGKFEHIISELGLDLPHQNLEDAEDLENIQTNKTKNILTNNMNYIHKPINTICLASPFDYTKSLLYIPKYLPEHNHKDFNVELINSLWSIILSSAGHTLVLCTTLKAVEQSSLRIQELLQQHKLEWPLLIQGNSTRSQLLKELKTKPNAILVGSQSFWEGVDISGNALRLVIIDKLPFATPDDPITAGRIKYFTEQNLNAFMQYQLPHASILLQQGAGRLIRGENDKGVLVIGDKRLVEKQYGKILLQSLPNFTLIREEAKAINFFIKE